MSALKCFALFLLVIIPSIHCSFRTTKIGGNKDVKLIPNENFIDSNGRGAYLVGSKIIYLDSIKGY